MIYILLIFKSTYYIFQVNNHGNEKQPMDKSHFKEKQ